MEFRKYFFLTGVVVLGLASYAIWQSLKFHIVSTGPKLSAVDTSSSYIDIRFNKALSDKNIAISSTPYILKDYSVENPKTLRLNWTGPLTAGQKYSIDLVSVSSTGGAVITNKHLVFTAKPVVFSNLSTKEQQTLVNSQDNNQVSDKLFGILPHYSPYYKLEAVSNGNTRPSISFTYLAPPPDSISSATSKTRALSDAKAWLIKSGITLSQYKLTDSSTNQVIP